MPPQGIEFDLLCAVAGPRPDLGRANELLKRDVDLDVLFSLAEWHAVRPALAALAGIDDNPERSADLKQRASAFERPHVTRSLSMAGELTRVGRALAASGIPFFVFKGPILALQLYGGLAQREYADIDLLVPPDRSEAAKALLASLGYRNSQGDPVFVRTFLGAQRQVALERPGLAAAIDLHWAFTGRKLPFPLAAEDVWSGLDTVVVAGQAVPTLATEDLALLLAGHGTKEAWLQLNWVADFAFLVERHPELDWARLLARARRRHCGDAVLLAMTMAHRLLGTAIPDALLASVAGRPRVGSEADRIITVLRQGIPEGPREHLYDLLLCDRPIDRWRALARTTLTPTAGDYHAMPLPRALWPLYWLTRPFRLAGRALRRG